MDYEKAYKELIEKLRKAKDDNDVCDDRYCVVIDDLIPELEESEDERIRKWLVELVKNTDTNHSNIKLSENCKLALAYLEKHKEQEPLSTEETELNSIAFLEQMGYTCIPPKKEHQNNSDAPKNALGGALNSPLDKDKNLDDIAQDYVEAVKEYNPELTWDLMQTAVCYGYHYREEEEQKPNIELIQRSWYMEGYTDGKFKREPMWNLVTGKGGPMYEKNEKYGQPLEQKPVEQIDGFRMQYKLAKARDAGEKDVIEHPELYGLSKLAEWSLTDATFIEEIDETLFMAETGRNEVVKNQIERERNWIKSLPERFSLQPAEWSEEDEKMFQSVSGTIEYAYGKTSKVTQWLKSLRQHPHWKPSEEQMEYLTKAVKTLGEEGDCKTSFVLNDLRKDLKKL